MAKREKNIVKRVVNAGVATVTNTICLVPAMITTGPIVGLALYGYAMGQTGKYLITGKVSDKDFVDAVLDDKVDWSV